MTVKVVSGGPTQPKRRICTNCTCELEYTGVDVKKIPSVTNDLVYSYIVCPHCQMQLSVEPWANAIPLLCEYIKKCHADALNRTSK